MSVGVDVQRRTTFGVRAVRWAGGYDEALGLRFEKALYGTWCRIVDAKLCQTRGNNEDLSRQWKGILHSFYGTTGTVIVGDLDKSGGQWLGRSNTAT
jgi:hypothetical protein